MGREVSDLLTEVTTQTTYTKYLHVVPTPLKILHVLHLHTFDLESLQNFLKNAIEKAWTLHMKATIML